MFLKARARYVALAALTGCTFFAGSVLAQTPAASASASADPNASAQEQALAPTSTTPPVNEHRLKWRFPRFRWWEYAAAGVVSVGNVSLELLYDKHPKDRWTKPILADSAVRNLLRADSDEGVRRAQKVSDFIWYGSTYYVVADGILTPLVTDKLNVDVAFQLTLLNWQAIGTAGLVARAFHDTVGAAAPALSLRARRRLTAAEHGLRALGQRHLGRPTIHGPAIKTCHLPTANPLYLVTHETRTQGVIVARAFSRSLGTRQQLPPPRRASRAIAER